MTQLSMTPTESDLQKALPARHAARAAVAMLSAALATLAGGCATPNLGSTVAVPDRYVAAPLADTGPEIAWWENYSDPVLTGLIRRAAVENRDVRMAAERLRAARAGADISRSWLMPSINATAGYNEQRSGYDWPITERVPDTQARGAGLGVSWEIDLAGGLRAGARAAEADALAAEHVMRGVRLLVLSDVASNYFMLVGALRQLETVRAISAAQDDTLRLVEARRRVGLATPFDVERARTDAARARAAIPPLETLAAVTRHRIAVLVGDQPADAASITPGQATLSAPETHPGQPAELLQRRPDLLAAKAQLDAANARRQQAQAEWFPHLFVDALFGRGTMDLNGYALGATRFTNASALLAMPIFNAGRTLAINDIAEAGQREAVLRYEQAIVRALEDVENALVALDHERSRTETLRIAATSADAAYGRAKSLYDRGQIDLLPLLDAERTRLVVRVSSNESDTKLLLDTVQLYKALGGGWQAFEPLAANSPQP
jgi:NodT family efflux transporter outer membrane factor (OMF) lipoprotein